MDDNADDSPSVDQKRPYAKPEVREVPLRPEEAVLGACKTSARSGPAQLRCSFPTSCSSLIS
ncbi:MAG TPA: hypothetical protein VFB07_10020 [Vicinamibacterales bacterium]|nr:hypothetical protein [Vicinamibacterales bacterium]